MLWWEPLGNILHPPDHMDKPWMGWPRLHAQLQGQGQQIPLELHPQTWAAQIPWNAVDLYEDQVVWTCPPTLRPGPIANRVLALATFMYMDRREGAKVDGNRRGASVPTRQRWWESLCPLSQDLHSDRTGAGLIIHITANGELHPTPTESPLVVVSRDCNPAPTCSGV